MVIYECFRCGYKNKIKTRFINHLNRKFTCKVLLKDIGVDDIYKYYFNTNNNINKKTNIAKNSQNIAKYSQNIAKYSQPISHDLHCKYCNRKFSHLSSKYKHEKN